MKKIKFISIALIIVIIACLLIIPKILAIKEKDQKNQQSTSSQTQTVTTDAYLIKAQTLNNEIKTIGTIRANEEVELRSEISKKITGIFFKEGALVSKGKILFQLDDSDLKAKLKKQEIEEKLALSKRDRLKKLIEKGLTPEESFETIENDLEKIKADIELTKVEIAQAKILAPFSGIIGLRKVSVGSYVIPDYILATIQDISKLKVDFSVPEKYISSIRQGQDILFSVSGVEGEFIAKVYAYEPKIENDTRSLLLRAITSNTERKLMPGNFANVIVRLSDVENAIMIPTQALIPQLKGQSVYVFRNGIAKSINVDIGQRTEEYIQITSGLSTGDTVITTNMLRLKPDANVKLIKIY